MNATARQGVWAARTCKDTTVIADTKRNKIIKRENGKASIFHFPKGIKISDVQSFMKTNHKK